MLDEVKTLGFLYATRAGISIGIDDMVVPDSKKTLVKDAEKEVVAVQQQYQDGAITHGERYNKIIEIWSGSRKRFPTRCSAKCSAATKQATSIRFTSWPTPALADRNSRSASSPVCAD